MRTSGEPVLAVHVVAGLSKSFGGPSYSVPALVAALARIEIDVLLRTIANGDEDTLDVAARSVVLHEPGASSYDRMVRASPGMRTALDADARAGAILHSHGLWLMPNIYPSWAKKSSAGAARLVHSPRGMLSAEALKFSSWKNYPFWLLHQKHALEAADCLHVTATSEYQEVRTAGLRNPVAIIPNAVELTSLNDRPSQAAQASKTILSLGRIHPKKGLDRLVGAWSALEAEFAEWRLRVIGPAEGGYDGELLRLSRSLGCERVTIEGPLYAEDKAAAFRAADLFVLSSLNENFGLTVAESLAAGTPVISTKGAPWCGLRVNRCGWWIDHGVAPLAAALRTAMSLPNEERRAMGMRGREWIARNFTWDKVARDFVDLYRWVRSGSEAPATVIFD